MAKGGSGGHGGGRDGSGGQSGGGGGSTGGGPERSELRTRRISIVQSCESSFVPQRIPESSCGAPLSHIFISGLFVIPLQLLTLSKNMERGFAKPD